MKTREALKIVNEIYRLREQEKILVKKLVSATPDEDIKDLVNSKFGKGEPGEEEEEEESEGENGK